MVAANHNDRASNNEANIAEEFVRARLEARALSQYPGAVPIDFAGGYRCQDIAIARWPDLIGGWKVTNRIPPEMQPAVSAERLVGPAFAQNIRRAVEGQVVDCPVFAGGMSGVEPELVVCVGRDAPPDKVDWTIDEAIEMVGELHIGAEVLSSPLSTLVEFGLPATVADFGCNFGIVVGKPVPAWRTLHEVAAQCSIGGESAVSGVTSLRGEVLASLAFALGKCAGRGYPLQAGSMIATGTVTRFHPIQPGQSAHLEFAGIGEIVCRAVQATPRSQTQTG